jgi:hypothetical protein
MRLAACTALVLAAALAACGESVHDGNRMTRTGALPVRIGNGGRLVAQPSPLTLADLRRYPAGSPQAQVMRTLFFAQWGGLNAVADTYTPAVRKALGDTVIDAAYGYNRFGLATALPRLRSVRSDGSTATVTVTFFTHERPPQSGTYMLSRVHGTWRIGYDSALFGTIPAIVRGRQRAAAALARYMRATQVKAAAR